MTPADLTLVRYALLFARRHLDRPLADDLLVEAAQEVRPDLQHAAAPLHEVLRAEVDRLLASLGR